jgi:hypothetical protein
MENITSSGADKIIKSYELMQDYCNEYKKLNKEHTILKSAIINVMCISISSLYSESHNDNCSLKNIKGVDFRKICEDTTEEICVKKFDNFSITLLRNVRNVFVGHITTGDNSLGNIEASNFMRKHSPGGKMNWGFFFEIFKTILQVLKPHIEALKLSTKKQAL